MEAIEKEMLSAREAFDLRKDTLIECRDDMSEAYRSYCYIIGSMEPGEKVSLSANEELDLRKWAVFYFTDKTEALVQYRVRYAKGDIEAVKDYENFKQKERERR